MAGIGLGIGIQYGRVLGGLSAEALAWKTRIEANGGTIPAATLAIIDDNLIKPLVAANMFTEFDRLNLYAGLSGYEIAARTNLIKSAHYVTPVSSPIFDNNGYKSGGTSYLDLNYNSVTHAIKCLPNNNYVGVCSNITSYGGYYAIMGAGSGPNSMIIERYATPSIVFLDFSNTAGTETGVPTGIVFAGMVKDSLTSGTTIVNTNTTSLFWGDYSNVNRNQYELTVNAGGGPDPNMDTMYHRSSWHASNLVSYITLRTLLLNTFTALGL
jgi:hypothetical protein